MCLKGASNCRIPQLTRSGHEMGHWKRHALSCCCGCELLSSCRDCGGLLLLLQANSNNFSLLFGSFERGTKKKGMNT